MKQNLKIIDNINENCEYYKGGGFEQKWYYKVKRAVLINNDIEMVHLENESILMNVNKKEEMKSAVDYISKNQ